MKPKITFLWQGVSGRYGIWKDGLWAAMKLLEEEYDVEYKEPWDEVRPDSLVLYWEAPVTIIGENSEHYKRVLNLPNKKCLLFAGGRIEREWVEAFDHIFVESAINANECEMMGLPYSTAFGINSDIFKPMNETKQYLGIHHGSCASWKRQWLVGEAVGEQGLIVGRDQASDPYPFERCSELGCTVLPEHDPEDLVKLLNQSMFCLQTSDYWGGGQRCTLEAMACNLWPIVMSDSPKNREYVEESGFGSIVEPDSNSIKREIERLMYIELPQTGRDYVLSKWTPKHYKDNLNKIIKTLC